ncbi:putative vacuolar protein sorting-associated protein 11 [Cardiosporidium cionae]|uniref:Vacuolar protein sorting-associated protein 11 n=1 Tax=Cardiosporidium cionae TaxID=476202 RepID=A0ABQ7JE21_9APIC|nr:putative vacuolar protein sorting-associated protein 11 [Cardiosporidium cionae]|eukprot:KAF8822150.1 putative vacuolar protein sorting-associated protein 11 [Cardiosporidium cionae]
MNGIFIFSHEETDHSLIVHKLREKYITDRLDILVRKRLFDWATAIAIKEEQTEDVNQALKNASQKFPCMHCLFSMIFGRYIEPSYVIEKYLDAQRIHNLADYLMKVHEAGLAVKEHTTMLFKCYTMLQEVPKIDEFIKVASMRNYDLGAAIETCRDSGYARFALDIALNQSYHEMYVTILIEDFKVGAVLLTCKFNARVTYPLLFSPFRDFTKAIQYMRTLNPPIACSLIMKFGRTLMKHQPNSSLTFINQIMRDYKPGVEVFIPLFLDCNDRLQVFLSTFLQSSPVGNEPNAVSHTTGSTAVLTYLELLLRSYKYCRVTPERAEEKSLEVSDRVDAVVENSQGNKKTNSDLNRLSSLSQSIMKLLKEHCTQKEEDIRTALNLCHVYEFEPGLVYCSEKSQNYQLPLGFFIHEKNVEGLLSYCLKCGLNDPILWTEALSFFASSVYTDTYLLRLPDSQSAMLEVLKHIGRHRLLPPLGVLDILKEHPNVTISTVKPQLFSSSLEMFVHAVIVQESLRFFKTVSGILKEYLLSSFDRSSATLATSTVRLERDNLEIERMREDITKIKTSVKLFQQKKCSQCDLVLDLPSVYFYCGHSYHMYCLSSDSVCQKCETNIRSKQMMLEQRELQGRNAEDFFKFLRGSGDGLDYIASCFGKGMFSKLT